MSLDIIYLMKKEMFRRRYSLRSIETYVFCVRSFMRNNSKDPKSYSKTDIKEFLDNLAEKGAAAKTINVNLMALKFVFENILNKRFFIKIPCSKTAERLPEVLTKEETARLFENIVNEKHRLMIKLMYSAGLRVSELLNLRVRDFEFGGNYGFVRSGKGNKDRLFILAQNIKGDLECYIAREKISYDSFLFPGKEGTCLSIRTVQEIIKKAAIKAGMNKRVHPHTLRHSFATHLIENGCDITSVQSLLGHKSPETTMVYVHMASPKMVNVKSPLDTL